MQDRLGQRQWPCAVYLNPTAQLQLLMKDVISRVGLSSKQMKKIISKYVNPTAHSIELLMKRQRRYDNES